MSEEKTPWQKRMEGKSDEERKEILAEYGWEIKREWNGKYAEEDTDGDGFLDPIMENVYYYYGEEREDNEYYNWLKTAEMLYNLGWEVFLDENRTQMYYYYKDPSAMPDKAIYQDRNTGQYVVDNQYFDTKAEAEAYIENTPEGVQYVTPAWLNSAGDIVYRNKDNPGEPEKKFIPEGYVRGKDNIWRRYGGAEEMFYDPRARRPTFAGQSPFTVHRPRRRMSQDWNPMMGDRPASIVTGAGERRAYQGMPYYRYGPNYYDERGYTTGGYTGRGALPSMRPQRGTAPVPITKHELADEPEGGYYAPGVGGNVQMGEHQHHPETGETILPWIPGSHRDMYGEDRGLQANPNYKPEPLTEEEERAKLVAELKYLTMWMLTLGSVGSLAVIGMTLDSMNHGLLRWLTLTFWKQFGWYYKRHPGERSMETSRLSPQTRAIGNPGWSRISDEDIIDEMAKMHDEWDKLDAEEKKNRWKLEAEARERSIKFAKENPEIAKQQSIDFLKRLDKEPMFKFMTDRTKKGITPAEIASSKEFIDKLKEPYWETPEYRKVENHLKAEFDAWKEIRQAESQRPFLSTLTDPLPTGDPRVLEAEEAFDNLIIERSNQKHFANDYYKGSTKIVNDKTTYSEQIKDLNRQFEENFNKGHKRLIMSWYREKYPNDSPQIKQWMDEKGRLNMSEKPRNNSWLLHDDVYYPDGYKPIGNTNLVSYRGPVRPRHIVALHYNELVDLELDKRTFSSTDSHTGEMLISKEELAEDIKEQNKLRAEQKKIDDWTNRKFPTYEEMEAMTVEEYDKYQKRKSYAKPRTVFEGDEVEIIGDKKPTPEAKITLKDWSVKILPKDKWKISPYRRALAINYKASSGFYNKEIIPPHRNSLWRGPLPQNIPNPSKKFSTKAEAQMWINEDYMKYKTSITNRMKDVDRYVNALMENDNKKIDSKEFKDIYTKSDSRGLSQHRQYKWFQGQNIIEQRLKMVFNKLPIEEQNKKRYILENFNKYKTQIDKLKNIKNPYGYPKYHLFPSTGGRSYLETDTGSAGEKTYLEEKLDLEYAQDNRGRPRRRIYVGYAPELDPKYPTLKYPRKIISGGQVGADQAGLSAGKKLGIETGGTAPPKYMTSEGGKLVPQPKLLQSYGLVEGEPDTTIWRKRTAANAKMSDGTVWFGNNTSRGYHLTKKRATEFNKHWIENPSPEELKRWATKNKISVLNVAGNRTADVVATEKTIVDAFKTPESQKAWERRLQDAEKQAFWDAYEEEKIRLAESTPEAKVSRDAKLDILTDYEIQRRADEAELEELNRKVTAERAAQPKDIVPPFSEQRRQYFKEQARLSQEAWRGREWIRDRLPKQPLLSQPDWVITDEKIENLRRRKIEANRLAAKLPSTRAEDLLAFPETKISPDIDAPKVQEYQPNQYTRKLIDLYEKYTKDPGKWVTETSPAEVGETGGVQTQTRRWQPQPPGIRREPLMSLNQFEQAYGQDIRRLMESEDRRRLQDIQIEDGKPRAKQIPTSLFQAQADAEARRAYYDAALPESERIIADLETKIGRRLPYLPFEERARLISEIMEPRSDAREWLDRRQRLLERTRTPKEAFPSPRSYGPFRPQHKIPPLGPFEWDRPLQSRSPDTPKHLWGKTAYNITQQEWIKQANEKQLLEWIEYEATKRGPKAATKTRRAIPASQYYGIDVDRFKKLIAEHKKANPNIRMDYVATLEQLKSERDLRQKDIDRIVELKEAQAEVNLEQKLVDAKDFKSIYESDKLNFEQMRAGKKTYTLWNAQGSEGKWFDSDWQDIKRRGDAGEKLTGENLKRYNAYKEFWKPQSQLTRFNVWITHRTNLISKIDIPEAARGAPDPTSEMERWYYDLEDLSKEEKLRMFEKHHNARLTEIGMGHKIKPDEAKPKTQPKPKPTTPKPSSALSVPNRLKGHHKEFWTGVVDDPQARGQQHISQDFYDYWGRRPLADTLPEPYGRTAIQDFYSSHKRPTPYFRTEEKPLRHKKLFEGAPGPRERFNVFTDEAPSRGRLSALEHRLGVPPAPKPLEPGPASFRRMDPAYEGWGGEVGRRISSSRPYRWGQWALSEGTRRKPGGARLLAPVAGAHALEELVEDSPLEPYDRDLGPFKLSQAVGAVGGFAAPHVSFGAEIGQHYYGDWLHRPGSPLSEEQAQWAGAGIGAASMFWGPTAAATLAVPAVEGTWWAGKQIGERANLGAYLGEKYYGEPEEPEKMPKGKGYFGTPKQ